MYYYFWFIVLFMGRNAVRYRVAFKNCKISG
jgi:hypothetical protein